MQAFVLMGSMIYCSMKETDNILQARWLALAQRWQIRLANAGLGAISQAVGQAFKPLAPFAAQVLWITQPGFALFGHSEAIHSLAELLEAPQHPNDRSQPILSSQVDDRRAKS